MDIVFNTDEVMSVNRGRELITELTQNLYDLVNKFEKYKEYFQTFPIDLNILHVTIIGKKTNSCDFLESTSFANGQVFYYGNESAFSPPYHQETFEEAKNILREQNLKSWVLEI